MDKFNDQDIFDLLSIGIPEDFPEVVLCRDPSPSADALERIKKKTMNAVFDSNSCSSGTRYGTFSRWMKAAAAAAVLLSIMIASIGPAHVWAGMQKVISLVPGFGLYAQSEFLLVAEDIVRKDVQQGYIEVSGVLAKQDSTTLNVFINQVQGFNKMHETRFEEDRDFMAERVKGVYLVDQEGTIYRSKNKQNNHWSGTVLETNITMELPALNSETRLVTLVVPLLTGEDIRLDIPLVTLNEMNNWHDFSSTVSDQDITINAGADFAQDTQISLLVIPTHNSAVVDGMLGRFFEGPLSVTLTGKNNKKYQFERYGEDAFGRMNRQPNFYELHFEKVDPGEQEVTLTIPVIKFREEAKTRVTIPVPLPGNGIVDVNQSVMLGRFPLTLTQAEYVKDDKNGDGVRVYVDLGDVGRETFESFSIDMPGRSGFSYGMEGSKKGFQIDNFTIGLDDYKKENMTLFLQDPVYSIEGPWEITFQVD